MKTLIEIIKDEQGACFNRHGAFCAFSKAQFDEAKDPALELTDYVSIGAGLIAPKNTAAQLVNDLDNIASKGRDIDIELHGTDAIILRELNNHECFYMYDITDCVNALSEYSAITETMIRAVFEQERHNHD
jgi:hypothetical protein